MKRKARFVITSVTLLMLMLVSALFSTSYYMLIKNAKAQYTGTLLKVFPSNVTVEKNETFIVSVKICNVTELFGWQVMLRFDDTVVNTTAAEIWLPSNQVFNYTSDFFKFGPVIDLKDSPTNFYGDSTYLTIGAVLLGEQTPAFNGTGTLFTVRFTGKGGGTTTIEFNTKETKLKDTHIANIPYAVENGQATVPGVKEKTSSSITLNLDMDSVTLGQSATISGVIIPYRAHAQVTIHYRVAGGVWDNLAVLSTYPYGSYTYVWTSKAIGTFEFKASWLGDSITYGAESDIKTIVVFEPGFHDVAVDLDAPEYLRFGSSATLNATVHNLGSVNETNVQLLLFINGSVVDYEIIPKLTNGSSYTLNYLWKPSSEGIYNVTVYIPRVPGEYLYQLNNLEINFVTVALSEPEPLIRPLEGQWANCSYTFKSPWEANQTTNLGFIYRQYISRYLINITITMQDTVTGQYAVSWTIVDIMHRWDESGVWAGMWYPGWIETNVAIGSTIQLIDGAHTITGSRVIETAGLSIDCWELQIQQPYGNITFWYDKTTGLWIGMRAVPNNEPGPTEWATLAATNVPVSLHNVAVLGVLPSATEVYVGQVVNITVVVKNDGTFNETFIVTCKYELEGVEYGIGAQQIIKLAPHTNATIRFAFTTKDITVYIIKAENLPIPSEKDATDNKLTSQIRVKMRGDVNGDNKVDLDDIVVAALALGSTPDLPRWNIQADINGDSKIDIDDIILTAMNFGKTKP